MQLAMELKSIVYSGFIHNPGYVYSAHNVISQRTLMYVGSQIFLIICTLDALLRLELFGTYYFVHKVSTLAQPNVSQSKRQKKETTTNYWRQQ